MPSADRIYQHHDWQSMGLVELVRTMCRRRGDQDPGEPPTGKLKASVKAYVNHGRWVAECGTDGCGGAMSVDVEEPLFYCWVCGNQWANGAWARVEFPARREEIERLLLLRPAANGMEAVNRNWVVGEPLANLEAENAAHGIGG
jgi:hypothetical protein